MMSLIIPPLLNAASWTSGFTSGFLFAALLLFASMIKWPTEEERSEMIGEIQKVKKAEEAKSASSTAGNKNDTEDLGEVNKDGRNRGTSTIDKEAIQENVFGKDHKGGEDDKKLSGVKEEGEGGGTGEEEGEGGEEVLHANETEEEKKERLRKEEAEKIHKNLVQLSGDLKNWSKQVGPSAVKFFTEFTRVYKAHGNALGTLSASAEALANSCVGSSSEEAAWWTAISTALSLSALEHETIQKEVGASVLKKIQHLTMEQAHLQQQVEKETVGVMKRRSEANYLLDQARKEKTRAQAAVEKLLSTVADSSAPVTPKVKSLQGLVTKIAGREVNEGRATDQSKKLFKRLQECEKEVKAAEHHLEVQVEAAEKKIPTFVEDLKLLESTRGTSLKVLIGEFSSLYASAYSLLSSSSHRLLLEVSNEGTRGFESMVEEGEKEFGNKEGKIDMYSESVCALAALKPANMSPKTGNLLREASDNKNIGMESSVWLNAFSARIYRDAGKSFKFRSTFEEIMTRIMNKGKKPRWVGKFKVSDLRLGEVPPIVKGARWVPAHGISGSNLEYDAAVDCDMVYRGEGGGTIANKDVVSFTIETQIWISTTVFVPIKIVFKLVEMQGRMRIGVRKEKSFVSFLSNPYLKFDVRSEIGNSLYLRNAPFVERNIVRLVKKNIEKKMVWPKFMKIKLPWPKSWQPMYRGVQEDDRSWGKSKEEYEELLEKEKREREEEKWEEKQREEKEREEKEREEKEREEKERSSPVCGDSGEKSGERGSPGGAAGKGSSSGSRLTPPPPPSSRPPPAPVTGVSPRLSPRVSPKSMWNKAVGGWEDLKFRAKKRGKGEEGGEVIEEGKRKGTGDSDLMEKWLSMKDGGSSSDDEGEEEEDEDEEDDEDDEEEEEEEEQGESDDDEVNEGSRVFVESEGSVEVEEGGEGDTREDDRGKEG